MYNIQTFYGWQTQYKCVMSTHKIFYEYTQMCPHSTTKYTTNIPLNTHVKPRNACEHSANYLRSPTKYTTNTPLNAENRFIVPVYFCCHFIYCSKPNRRNQKQATLKITNKDRRIIPTHCLQERYSIRLRI